MKFFDNYFFFTIFIHYKLKLCRKISALMNKDHICQVVSKPTPRTTKLKNFPGHSSVKCLLLPYFAFFLHCSQLFRGGTLCHGPTLGYPSQKSETDLKGRFF